MALFLISCKLSAVLAPVAGTEFVTATVFLTKFTMPIAAVELTSSSYSIKSIEFSTFAGTLSAIPLPTVYVIVNVVFDGACPYVLVYKKFDGSISTSTDLRKADNPFPTLVGFGTNYSSLFMTEQ